MLLKCRKNRGVTGLRPPPGGPIAAMICMSIRWMGEVSFRSYLQINKHTMSINNNIQDLEGHVIIIGSLRLKIDRLDKEAHTSTSTTKYGISFKQMSNKPHWQKGKQTTL